MPPSKVVNTIIHVTLLEQYLFLAMGSLRNISCFYSKIFFYLRPCRS